MRLNTIAGLAAIVRGRRLEIGWSQGDLARQAAVSRKWINEFEGGKETVAIGTVLKVLDALSINLDTSTGDEHSSDRGDVDLDAVLKAHKG